MAPEQACGEAVDERADWYAVGSMLYQALTGRLPFEGSVMQILSRKAAGDTPGIPTLLVPDAPADLASLCMRLLAHDPAARPNAASILEALGAGDAEEMLAASRARAAPFVGRASEVAALRAAYARSREPGAAAVQVFVEGVSGIGKSATVAHAIEQIRAADPDVVVLRGRCHESETVPFNAFDGVVDDLSRVLRNLGPDAIALPRVGALLRLFPSLASVAALSEAAAIETGGDLSPVELRQLAFDQLRALVGALAALRPVVIVLDDVHWADAEALALLREWGGDPSAPSLLVATARPREDGGSCAAVTVARGDVERIAIGALTDGDARSLVDELVADGAPLMADVEAILAESGGHPMFLGELLAFSRARSGGPARGAVHLDDALLARAAALSPLASRALEVVATAGIPIREATVARVLDAPRTALAPQISVLRSARLLRTAGTRTGSALEPFHDRVREAVYRSLDGERRASLHRRIALLLEKEGAPHEILLTHFERAGDPARAVSHALAGAELAANGLAFERAASLYGYAVRSGLHDPARERELRTSMAEMFQRAGRPKDSAEAFAAAALTGDPDPNTAFELRRRATEQYLTGGYRDEGVAASRAVLAHVGESRPRWYALIIVLALWHVFLLRRARLDYVGRDAADVPPARRRLLDAYWSLTAGLVFLDSIRGATFASKGAILAVRYGDDLRVARATCAAVIGMSGKGEAALSRRLIDVVRRAAQRDGTDLTQFYVTLSEIGYAFMLENDCPRTLERCAVAKAQWAKIGHRGGWESDLVEQFELWSLAVMGELRRLDDGVSEGIRFARAMGNRFREFMFRASFPQGHMLRDAPAEGEADVKDALREWAHADGRYATPDYWALKSRCLLASYADDVDRMEGLEREWRRYDVSALNHLALLAMESSDLRASLALRRAIASRRRGDEAETARHLARARRFVRRLEKNPLRFARIACTRVTALVALIERGVEVARPLLERSIEASQREGWNGQLAGMRFVLGRAIGGDEGAALEAEARRWVGQWSPKNPERMLRMLVPGAQIFER
jgi:hypothetical protein